MKLELKNIGGLVGTHEYDLQTGVNRITGPSASGKSSIIRGIECLVTDDNYLFRRTLNDDSEVGHVKFGDYERNLQRVDAKTVKTFIDDETFYEKKSEWGYADDIVFFTPESNVVTEIEHGNFNVRRYIERISKTENITTRDIFRKEQQLDIMKKELEQYIDNLTCAQELEYDVEMLEGEIEELQEKEADLEKAVEKETGSKDLKIVAMDIASKNQDIREREARLRRRDGDVKLYTAKYENAKGSYDRLDAVIRKFEVDYPDPESQRDAFKDEMRVHEDKKVQLRSKKEGIDKIRELVEYAYEMFGDSNICPCCDHIITLESLENKRVKLRGNGAELAHQIKLEDEPLKLIRAEVSVINNSIAIQASQRCDRDRFRVEMNAAKKELDERQHLTDDIDGEIVVLQDELKVLQKDYDEVNSSLKSESKDELKAVQTKIGGFGNEIKNKRREVDKLTRSIPDYIIGETLEDYTNKKVSALEKLRKDCATLKENYINKTFDTLDHFNENIQTICTNLGFKSFNKLEIVKKMKRGELDSLDIIIQNENGKEQAIDNLSRMERMVLALVFQLSAREMYISDFPFFVFDEDINAFDEATHKSILKYLADNVEYVITSKSVDSNEQSDVIINHIVT